MASESEGANPRSPLRSSSDSRASVSSGCKGDSCEDEEIVCSKHWAQGRSESGLNKWYPGWLPCPHTQGLPPPASRSGKPRPEPSRCLAVAAEPAAAPAGFAPRRWEPRSLRAESSRTLGNSPSWLRRAPWRGGCAGAGWPRARRSRSPPLARGRISRGPRRPASLRLGAGVRALSCAMLRPGVQWLRGLPLRGLGLPGSPRRPLSVGGHEG